MAKEFTQIESQGPNGWTIWTVTGRIDTITADTAYAMGESILQKNTKMVLDMSDMDYISSAGLRVLLRLNKLAKKSASGIVKSVLEDSGMDTLFTTWGSLDELK